MSKDVVETIELVKAGLKDYYNDFISKTRDSWETKQVSEEANIIRKALESFAEEALGGMFEEVIKDVVGSMDYVLSSINTDDKPNYNQAGHDLYSNYSRALNTMTAVRNKLLKREKKTMDKNLTPLARKYMGTTKTAWN